MESIIDLEVEEMDEYVFVMPVDFSQIQNLGLRLNLEDVAYGDDDEYNVERAVLENPHGFSYRVWFSVHQSLIDSKWIPKEYFDIDAFADWDGNGQSDWSSVLVRSMSEEEWETYQHRVEELLKAVTGGKYRILLDLARQSIEVQHKLWKVLDDDETEEDS